VRRMAQIIFLKGGAALKPALMGPFARPGTEKCGDLRLAHPYGSPTRGSMA